MAYTPQSVPEPIGPVTVPTPGTPVQLTTFMQTITVGSGKMCVATDAVLCNKISLTASPYTHSGVGNTGAVYVGQQSMVKATGAGVIAVIYPGQSFAITNNVGMNIYDLSKLYLDSDTASDGIIGSLDTI